MKAYKTDGSPLKPPLADFYGLTLSFFEKIRLFVKLSSHNYECVLSLISVKMYVGKIFRIFLKSNGVQFLGMGLFCESNKI